MPSLTDKQTEVLDAIRRHFSATGQSPTVREIGQAVNLKSSCSVQKHLDSLERLGKITRSKFKYRSIELAEKYLINAAPAMLVPLLGRVAGGVPILSEPEVDPDILTLPESLLPRIDRNLQTDACASRDWSSAPFFAMNVEGDSMIGAGIADGDVVVARRQTSAQNGDIVIALLGGEEVTVKRFHKENGSVSLMPENDLCKPIISQDVQVLGRVRLAIKQF